MQTFLPYDSFTDSAEVLDYKRLGKQRVEARQIYNTLVYGSQWANHPAVKMWKGFESGLALYHNLIIAEWVKRGYRNNMPFLETGIIILPPWLGDPDFHISHQSNLLRKFPEHYGKFFNVPNDIPYMWPILGEGGQTA